MQNLEWYLADLKSTGKNTIETVEKSLTDMFIRLVRIYPCLYLQAFCSKFRGGGGADPPPKGDALCASHRAGWNSAFN